MIAVLVVGAAAALSWWVIGLVRDYAVRRAILDVPNERSSHSSPIPRGGGVGIVVSGLTVMIVLAVLGRVDARMVAGVAGGGLLVALTGWRDDRRGLSAHRRLLHHFIAAIWAVSWMGGLPTLHVAGRTIELGISGAALAVLGVVWSINLYNFMDGIDGLAGVEAVSVGAAGALLWVLVGRQGDALVIASIAAASLGFLAWNWSPARIFMGDVGSGFLGFVIAALALWSERQGGPSVLLWGVAAMVFVFDATATLLRRVYRRESLASAHRHHAYQRLVMSGASHEVVSLGILCLNILLGTIAVGSMVVGADPLAALIVGSALCAIVYGIVEWRRPM